MTGNSTTAPEGATTFTANTDKPAPLNLECITGDLSTVRVFAECLEHFIIDLRATVNAGGHRESIFREINSIDTMAYEIKQRIEQMRTGLDEFIDAAPAAHLWAERKPA
ncbi:MAG: hypothetical protein A2885_13555 [Sphingopyxis sp. RIFCSPHIGHO2_01_FULL_65_24]|nr:MAG: hypothetical protein A2885_13555 [Sphingopyxis sp. RIFCSPHIGHO2_01_FULL_65_24]